MIRYINISTPLAVLFLLSVPNPRTHSASFGDIKSFASNAAFHFLPPVTAKPTNPRTTTADPVLLWSTQYFYQHFNLFLSLIPLQSAAAFTSHSIPVLPVDLIIKYPSRSKTQPHKLIFVAHNEHDFNEQCVCPWNIALKNNNKYLKLPQIFIL